MRTRIPSFYKKHHSLERPTGLKVVYTCDNAWSTSSLTTFKHFKWFQIDCTNSSVNHVQPSPLSLPPLPNSNQGHLRHQSVMCSVECRHAPECDEATSSCHRRHEINHHLFPSNNEKTQSFLICVQREEETPHHFVWEWELDFRASADIVSAAYSKSTRRTSIRPCSTSNTLKT